MVAASTPVRAVRIHPAEDTPARWLIHPNRAAAGRKVSQDTVPTAEDSDERMAEGTASCRTRPR
jgi:hypothetical protein